MSFRNPILRLLAILVCVLLWTQFANAQNAPIIHTGRGTLIGTNTTQAVGFFGTTPAGQTSGTAELALSDSTGGVIPSAVTITGTVANVVDTGTVTIASGTGALRLWGVLPGDTVMSATYVSGTSTLSAAADFESTISGSNQIVQTGTSSGVGTNVTVTVGRYPTADYIVLVSGSTTANINADLASMAAAYNELRKALVNYGLIKGSP